MEQPVDNTEPRLSENSRTPSDRPSDPAYLVGGRYRLIEPIGAGGMGQVHRALDVLVDEHVAVKRVVRDPNDYKSDTVLDEPDTDATKSVMGSDTKQLALAREFSVLSSLRHPNIISVLDYGFESRDEPFFTMTLLSDAQTILDAAAGQPSRIGLAYLLHVLEALNYVHRHGIVHRDLKPSNVLVSDQRVVVLDFGIAGLPTGQVAGTPRYIAPEIIKGHPPTPASDFYAVGVMAYEILAGEHPFASHRSKHQLLDRVVTEKPDLSPLMGQPKLAELVGRLLSKKPRDRFGNAGQLIAAFADALGQSIPTETVVLRDSYLKAATFTGRTKLLRQLTSALFDAIKGNGSAWLIGGESGIGKTRLLAELRLRAQVEGALVLQGQCSDDPSTPYHLFQQAVLRLCLTVNLTDADAQILKVVYPDVERLLGRPIPDGPTMDPQAFASRFLHVVEHLFQRSDQPIVLLLEDCHWVRESSEIIRRLVPLIPKMPLLAIATYRDDDRPDLPEQLPEMHVSRMTRMGRTEITNLSVSILGEEVGRNETIITFLERETEGNAFFLVEVVRALAQEAGRLDRVDPQCLPDRVFAGGIKNFVQRRLSRLPPASKRMLRLAATLGRNVDIPVLEAIESKEKIEEFLAACSQAAILQGVGYEWRFSHDKFREGVLFELSVPERKELHGIIGAAIEQAHPGRPEWIQALAFHWHAAGIAEKAVGYLQMAAGQMLSIGAPEKAIQLASQAANCLGVEIPDGPELLGVAIGEESAEIGRLIGDRSPAELLELPELTDGRIGQIIQVLKLVQPAAHIARQIELFATSVLKCMRLSLEYGIGPETSFVFGTYASVVRGMTGDSRSAHDLSMAAIELDQRRIGKISPAVSFLHCWFVNHWMQHVRTNLPIARHGAEVGFQENDVLYAAFNAAAVPIYLNAAGAPLSEVIAVAEENSSLVDERVRVSSFHCLLERQFASAMAGKTIDPLSFTDEVYDDERDVASICETSNFNQIGYFFLAKLRLHYYFGSPRSALDVAQKAVAFQSAFQGQVAEWEFTFFHGLARLARAAQCHGDEREQHLALAQEALQCMTDWAAVSEPNFKHKQSLLRAEWARVSGEQELAAESYADAISEASKHQFLQHLALAHEKSAHFFREIGDSQSACEHLQQAIANYQAWGAAAKAADTVRTYSACGSV